MRSDPGEGRGVSVSGVLPRVVHTREALLPALAALRDGAVGETPRSVALVPTMGALHRGHLALLDRAREVADRVVLSIFVNPLQFGPGEDLDRYPRTLERDLALAASRGVDLVFAPPVEVMYPEGPPVVRVSPGRMGEPLCGAGRPGHFEGVLTVVARLFGILRPEVAVFGRKDAQQAALIRRMVRDLALGVEIEVAPLVREGDGLAMSSRNVYLSPEMRSRAPGIFHALREAAERFAGGELDPTALETAFRAALDRRVEGGGDAPSGGTGLFRVEYAQVVNPETLARPEEASPGDLLAVAVHLGSTRLLDNVVLGAPEADPRMEGTGAEERTIGGPPGAEVATTLPSEGAP